VANLFRYRDVPLTANRRYLDALAAVDDPTPAIHDLDRITQRRRTPQGQSVRAFNPLAREDRQLFEALSSGEHHIRGFTNQDLRAKLIESQVLKAAAQTVQQLAGKVSRLLRRLHLYGLIAKVPHARRWRVTRKGQEETLDCRPSRFHAECGHVARRAAKPGTNRHFSANDTGAALAYRTEPLLDDASTQSCISSQPSLRLD
jgi:hypothetical protein